MGSKKLKAIQVFAVAIAILLQMAITGCTQRLYPGEPLEIEKVSRIESRGVNLLSVDGQKVERDTRVAEILPGQHVIVAEVNGAPSDGPLSRGNARRVLLTTVAGETYYIGGVSAMPRCITILDARGRELYRDADGCSAKMSR